MSLKFQKVRALVTVQDSGRWKFQSIGVPVSGAMDEDALFQVNTLVGNARSVAGLEIGVGELDAKITANTLIAFSGNAHELFIDGTAMPANKAIQVDDGSIIRLKPKTSSLWSYLAIGGGVDVPAVLGSRSTYLQAGFGGLNGSALKAGDEIQSGKKSTLTEFIIKSLSDKPVANWCIAPNPKFESNLIRIFTGPEWNWLSDSGQNDLIKGAFSVTKDCSRMGYRLSGSSISRKVKEEMISSGVTRGTIQLTNDGSLIVLMADGQTVGGYPRVAQIAAVDISRLAQMRPNETIRFSLISPEEAEQLLINREQERSQIIQGIRLKFV